MHIRNSVESLRPLRSDRLSRREKAMANKTPGKKLGAIFFHSSNPFSSSLLKTPPSSRSPNRFHAGKALIFVYSLIPSAFSSSKFTSSYPCFQSSHSLHWRRSYSCERELIFSGFLLTLSCGNCRSFSGCSSDGKLNSSLAGLETLVENSSISVVNASVFSDYASSQQVSDIIDSIRSDPEDLEAKLESMNVSLSDASLTQIFRVLNCEKVSAFRFFSWIKGSLYEYRRNSDIWSLVVNNFGRLDDYEGMLLILNDFKRNGIHLSQKAFGFLPVLFSEEKSTLNCVKRVVEILNKVGGSCQSSGIQSLIEMFCHLGSFRMAEFVIETAGRRTSYYKIIVKERCRKCDFEGAKATIREMKQLGWLPDASLYNYLLSSLLKNDRTVEAYELLEEMQEEDCPPNKLTFDIFIHYLCKTRKIDSAFTFLDRLTSSGLEPRLSTHAAFIKGLFNSQRYEEAYKYVLDSGEKHPYSKNVSYKLLASLHLKRGDLVVALNILLKMINEGLRPDFRVYTRVFKRLRRLKRDDLANELSNKFSSFSFQSS